MVGKKRVARWVALRPTRESDEQANLCKWLLLQYPRLVFFSIPNDGKRSDSVKFHLHETGMLSGMPDLVILSKPPVFVEMKRKKGGVLSPAQKEVHKWIKACGYTVLVCRGFDDARAQLKKYL